MKQISQWSDVQYDLIQLVGGMDQTTPSMALKPGMCRDALNYEVSISGGYSRIGGYERYDGSPSPSSATFTVLPVTVTGAATIGFYLVDDVDDGFGVIEAIGSDYIVISLVTGTFNVGDPLIVQDPEEVLPDEPVGTVAATSSYFPTPLLTATYAAVAADRRRAEILQPGGGPDGVLGVAMLNGDLYAWRETTDGDFFYAGIFLANDGWQEIQYFNELSFDTGTVELFDGDEIFNGIASSATVKRVVLESGSWSGGTAAGRLIIDAYDGQWLTGETIERDGTPCATVQSDDIPIRPEPGGRYEFAIGNFGGQSGTTRLYGVDGVNRGFEFDGEVYVPISTGMTLDQPTHVAVFQNHLFYSFGSSVQHSGIGFPYVWSPIFGAAELAPGDVVTGFLVQSGNQNGGAMAIFMRDDCAMLYGTTSADWKLVKYNLGVGALEYTQQNLTESFFFDDRGVMSLSTTLNYGNFDSASLTQNLKTFISAHRNSACASTVSRDKSQYRVFFSDGWGLYMTVVNGKLLGSFPIKFPTDVYCSCQGEDSAGNEVSFFGSSDGYVYQFDRGSSFDGQSIRSYFTLAYNHIKSPRIKKRYRRASIETIGNFYNEFKFGYSLGYSSINVMQPSNTSYETDFSAPYWDTFVWDLFTWDGITISPIECEIQGSAENIGITIASSSAILYPSTMNTIILHYTPRRGIR